MSEWVSESRSVVSNSLRPWRLHSPWNSPEQNAGVGSLSLLQGICPTQGSNPGLLHCRWILYWLSYKGSLVDCGIERGIGRGINKDISGTEFKNSEIAIPLSRGSSQPRDWTWVSHIAAKFFTIWATREAHILLIIWIKREMLLNRSDNGSLFCLFIVVGFFFLFSLVFIFYYYFILVLEYNCFSICVSSCSATKWTSYMYSPPACASLQPHSLPLITPL